MGLLAFLVAGPAAGQVTADWGSVVEVAERAFAAGAARGYEARIRGIREAGAAVAGRWRNLGITAEPGVGVVNRELGAADSLAGVGATVELADRARTSRAALEAAAATAGAEAEVARLAFLLAASEAWLRWSEQALVAEHLVQDASALDALIAPLREAAGRGGLTQLDLLDLEAELARARTEALQARRLADDAAAELSAVLGRPVEPSSPDADGWLTSRGAAESPWLDVAARAGQLPALRVMELEAAAAEARATALELNPLSLTFGALIHVEDNGFTWTAGTLTLDIPLSNPGAAEAAAARGEAQALTLERDWQEQKLRAALTARHLRHQALIRHRAGLQETLLSPLRARVERVRAALARGATDVPRLIRSWRELHEAEHAYVVSTIQIAHDRAEAARLIELIDRVSTEGGPR